MGENYNSRDIITIVIGLISVIIPVYFFFITSPEKIRTQTIVVFIGIVIIIIISIIIIYIYNKWLKIINALKIHNADIIQVKKDLKINESLFNLDKRIAIMESITQKLINKKSQIDPRIIIWILLIILLLLFLKTIGIFG